MYFPYLRGRQFELIALRELLEGKRISEKVIPIIEPVKPSSTLLKTLETFVKNDREIAVVFNPTVGDFAKKLKEMREEDSKVANELYDLLTQNDKVIKSYIMDRGILSEIKSEASKNKYLIINLNRDCLDDFLDAYEDTLPRFTLIPDDRAFRRVIPDSKVLFEDNFNKQSRNIDYIDNQDEFFSDSHLYYQNENYVGFADYSVVGEEFNESWSKLDAPPLPFAPAALSCKIALCSVMVLSHAQRLFSRRSRFARISLGGHACFICKEQNMRPVLPAGNRRIHRSADGSAQQERGTLRGGHLFCHAGTFPRNRNAALFDERKRQLLKRRGVGDRAGNRRVILLAMRRHPCCIFRAGMQRRCLQSEPIERIFQKRYALLERIQKSHLQIRTQNEQRHARKACARSDVDDLCAVRKQPMRQRRGTV